MSEENKDKPQIPDPKASAGPQVPGKPTNSPNEPVAAGTKVGPAQRAPGSPPNPEDKKPATVTSAQQSAAGSDRPEGEGKQPGGLVPEKFAPEQVPNQRQFPQTDPNKDRRG